MKRKDFEVIKTEEQFLKNYSLHDKAEKTGKRILDQLGYLTIPFGEDRRHESLWEAGQDKPDCFVIKKDDSQRKKLCLLDWKGKRSTIYRINERAYNSYLKISEQISLKLIIAMAVFSKEKLEAFKYFILPDKKLVQKRKKEWDGNYTVVFDKSKAFNINKINTFLEKVIKS